MLENIDTGMVLNIVVSVLGLAWTFFKGTEWYRDNVSKPRRAKVIDSVQAGVKEVYEGYTRSLKKASEDGKLTDAERAEALKKAKAAAIQYGKDNGVDIVKNIGAEFVNLYLERAHKEVNKNEK